MDSVFVIGLILSALLGFVGSVLANRFDTPIGRFLDTMNAAIRKWRLKRAKDIERQVRMLEASTRNLIAYCAVQTITLVSFLILLMASMAGGLYFSETLHNSFADKNSLAAMIAWRCISFASCTHEQFGDRIYRNSFSYFTVLLTGSWLAYLIVFYIFKFKQVVKASTDLQEEDFD